MFNDAGFKVMASAGCRKWCAYDAPAGVKLDEICEADYFPGILGLTHGDRIEVTGDNFVAMVAIVLMEDGRLHPVQFYCWRRR